MQNFLLKTAMSVGTVVLGIFLAGILLDEMNKGNAGDFLKSLAKKSTNGYGALAS